MASSESSDLLLVQLSKCKNVGRHSDTNLRLWVNETDSMLVDGDQENLRKHWLCGLLNNIQVKFDVHVQSQEPICSLSYLRL